MYNLTRAILLAIFDTIIRIALLLFVREGTIPVEASVHLSPVLKLVMVIAHLEG